MGEYLANQNPTTVKGSSKANIQFSDGSDDFAIHPNVYVSSNGTVHTSAFVGDTPSGAQGPTGSVGKYVAERSRISSYGLSQAPALYDSQCSYVAGDYAIGVNIARPATITYLPSGSGTNNHPPTPVDKFVYIKAKGNVPTSITPVDIYIPCYFN